MARLAALHFFTFINHTTMGKKITRTEAARMLNVHPQTISNYAKKGLIDEIRRKETNGKVYCYYDKTQLQSLEPKLTDLNVLHGRIEEEHNALLKAKDEIWNKRKEAERDLGRIVSVRAHYDVLRRVVTSAYVFAGKLHPEWNSRTEQMLIDSFVRMKSTEEICRELNISPVRVKTAALRLARRIVAMEDLGQQAVQLKEENERLKEKVRILTSERPPHAPSAPEDEPVDEKFLQQPLSELCLSRRAYNTLLLLLYKKGPVSGRPKIKDVLRLTEKEVSCAKNCGRKTLFEIKFVLGKYGLRLSD